MGLYDITDVQNDISDMKSNVRHNSKHFQLLPLFDQKTDFSPSFNEDEKYGIATFASIVNEA